MFYRILTAQYVRHFDFVPFVVLTSHATLAEAVEADAAARKEFTHTHGVTCYQRTVIIELTNGAPLAIGATVPARVVNFEAAVAPARIAAAVAKKRSGRR